MVSTRRFSKREGAIGIGLTFGLITGAVIGSITGNMGWWGCGTRYTIDVRTHCVEARMRIIVGTLLLSFAAFCSYGFLASFEYPGITMWKVGYALLAVVSLYGGYKLIRSGR
jgi:hypothetical protein